MLLVYIAGPFRGNNAWDVKCNVHDAEELAIELWRCGFAVICPHSNSANFDGAAPDFVFLEGDLEILVRCDALITLDTWEKSEGATAEVEFAHKHNIPVFHKLSDILDWRDKKNAGN